MSELHNGHLLVLIFVGYKNYLCCGNLGGRYGRCLPHVSVTPVSATPLPGAIPRDHARPGHAQLGHRVAAASDADRLVVISLVASHPVAGSGRHSTSAPAVLVTSFPAPVRPGPNPFVTATSAIYPGYVLRTIL